jgi:hypothetical protein
MMAVWVATTVSGCTVVDTAVIRHPPGARGPFVTTGDISQPYDSLGLIQVTRKGVILFGYFDVIGADLQGGFEQALLPIVQQMGGDGVINVRFGQIQYLPFTRVVGALFFFAPLPAAVTLTGEVVKLRGGAAPPAGP